ncbi:MAG TPA: nickel pincer cofactor biosynthesis protein LarB [Actinomycetota bacterium]|nr:nickel pincer cofactor biosynthesis protein LarB [Actinomycetota bacterium]
MRPDELKDLLRATREGRVSLEDAASALGRSPVEDLGFARLDTHRELRQGIPEAIYGAGKTSDEIIEIAHRMLSVTSSPVVATRVDAKSASSIVAAFPDALHHERARMIVFRRAQNELTGRIVVVCAGTSDLPVADEAAVTADALGAVVGRVTDVGVAGIHRVLASEAELREADVVIVVAGMEGALASVVGGVTPAPVIAVPTSIGYGASFEGLAALLTMLNSCAAGVVVTNIDNGYGAACAAVRILNGGMRS